MKKELLRGFTMLMLMVVIALATAVASANAQSSNKAVANIPFEFVVGSQALPAGEYALKASETSNVLMIQSADAKSSAIRLTNAIEPRRNKTHARLVFHRYGQRYFLAEVWSGANLAGRQLLRSREERAIERELACVSSKSATAKNTYEIVEVVTTFR
jgi:hypothetical protein